MYEVVVLVLVTEGLAFIYRPVKLGQGPKLLQSVFGDLALLVSYCYCCAFLGFGGHGIGVHYVLGTLYDMSSVSFKANALFTHRQREHDARAWAMMSVSVGC